MSRSDAMAWLRRQLASSICRYREMNNGARIGLKTGWLVIVLGLSYTFSVVYCSFAPDSFPMFTSMALLAFLFWALSFGSRVCLVKDGGLHDWPKTWKVFAAIAIPYLIIAIFGWFTSRDTEVQWRQVVGERGFDDWHPVVHTFLIYAVTMPFRSYQFALSLQSLILAWLITWLYATFRRYKYNMFASIVVVVLAAVNPFSITMVRVLWKDTAFAMAGLALTVCLVNIFETKGGWLRGWRLLLVATLLFLASFLRHNGFFFTVPFAFLLPFVVSRGNILRAVVCVALSFACSIGYVSVRSGLANAGVIQNKRSYQGFSEAVGLPMSMMSECYVASPGKVPADVFDFLSSIGSMDFWRRNYKDNFQSIKNAASRTGVNTGVKIYEIGGKKFLDMFARTVVADPKSAMRSFRRVTSTAWSPFPQDIHECVRCYCFGSNFLCADIIFLLKLLSRLPFGALIAAPGAYALCVVLALCLGLMRSGLRVAVFALPLMCYHFGTMLLLTRPDYRFFYLTTLVGGATVLLLLTSRASSDCSDETDLRAKVLRALHCVVFALGMSLPVIAPCVVHFYANGEDGNAVASGQMPMKSGNVTSVGAYLLRLHRNNSERDGATAGRQLKLNTDRKLPTVRELGWSRTDATFKGWATTAKNAAAGKVAYKDGATVKNLVLTAGDAAHLYAVWQ